MKVTDYKIESWYDFLNVDGKNYRNSNSPPPAMHILIPGHLLAAINAEDIGCIRVATIMWWVLCRDNF